MSSSKKSESGKSSDKSNASYTSVPFFDTDTSEFFLGIGKQGTAMSFGLLVVSMVLSIVMLQYAPSHIHLSTWNDGCPNGYEDSCKANSAVFRFSFALTIMFVLQALGSAVHPKFYDVFWVPKIIAFICVVIGFYFASSSIFGLGGYAWVARITGFLYLILQQIILLDVAYSWNERWVAYSCDDGEMGSRWLRGLLMISTTLFVGSLVVIALLYWQFDGCPENVGIITITLVLPALATIYQVFFSEEGSLLVSAIMFAYCTYICYSSVTLNPDASCNPTISSGYQTISKVVGFVFLVVSLVWTTYNTVCKIPVDTKTGGSVDLMSVATGGSAPAAIQSNTIVSPYLRSGMRSLFVQISIVFILISGYYAMILTNWGTMQQGGSQSNPRTGRAAMWIQAAGQWIAIIIYFWSLVAPKIFPNRDFGG